METISRGPSNICLGLANKLNPKQKEKLQQLKEQVSKEAAEIFKAQPDLLPRYTNEDHLVRLLIARD